MRIWRSSGVCLGGDGGGVLLLFDENASAPSCNDERSPKRLIEIRKTNDTFMMSLRMLVVC
jgi:hypothetical protein